MKKALLFGTFLAFIGVFASSTNAQVGSDIGKSREILFKIHDIKPNKDSDGLVTDCGFLITFYNRTDYEIDSASLDLRWVDDTGNYILEQNEKEVASKLSTAKSEDEQQKDEDFEDKEEQTKIKATSRSISTFIDMPPLKAYTQTTISGKLDSDKCFLLQDDVKFKVTACKINNSSVSDESKTFSNTTRERSIESCSRMFKYVSPRSPEYYREFKAISVSDQQKILESDLAKSLDAIEAKYNNVLTNIDSTKDVLAEIK